MLYRENGQFKTSYRADQQMLPIRQDRLFMVALLLVAFLVVPLVTSDYVFRALIVPFLILAISAIGLNILVGYCGQISLGQAGFMAVGAYAAYNFTVRVPELNFLIVLVLAGGVSALVGIVFGIPSLRIKGLYLAVATLAAQFFLDWAFIRIKWFTNNSPSGSVSTSPIELFGWVIDRPVDKYWFVLGIVVVLTLAAKNMVRSAIGRSWMAIRDMDVAAEVIGIRGVHAKLTAFAVCSFYAGVSGALWGFIHLGAWEPLAFNINVSFNLLFMIIIGGMGSLPGAVVGAAVWLLLPAIINGLTAQAGDTTGLLRSVLVDHKPQLVQAIFGSLVIVLLIFAPWGIAGMASRLKARLAARWRRS